GRVPGAPRLEHHSAEASVRKGDLKRKSRVWNIMETFSSRVGITNRVVNGCVRRSGYDTKDDALVFRRCELLRCESRNRREHKESEQRNSTPDHVNRRPSI